MKRRLKHDPAQARFTVRFVGIPTDSEVRHQQSWSLHQLVDGAMRSIAAARAARQGAVA